MLTKTDTLIRIRKTKIIKKGHQKIIIKRKLRKKEKKNWPKQRIFIFKQTDEDSTLIYLSSTARPHYLTAHTLTIHSGDCSDHVPAASHPKPWQQNDGKPPPPQPPTTMSLSCPDRFSDSNLLCGEDTSGILSGESPEFSSSDVDSSSPPQPSSSEEEEESIAGFIEDERNFVPGFDYLSRFQSRSLDASARKESVAWILKVTAISPYFQIEHSIVFIITLLPRANTESDDAKMHRW